MKGLWSWLSDPCVHLIGVGLVLVRLTMGIGAEPENDEVASVPVSVPCHVCGAAHEAPMPCPLLSVKQIAVTSAR